MLAFRCTVRFLPEAALLKLCSRVNLPDPAPSCCFETVTWVRPVSIHTCYRSSFEFSLLGFGTRSLGFKIYSAEFMWELLTKTTMCTTKCYNPKKDIPG